MGATLVHVEIAQRPWGIDDLLRRSAEKDGGSALCRGVVFFIRDVSAESLPIFLSGVAQIDREFKAPLSLE